ncbi:MAG: phytanoyl-CoA dioxygenase family protein [Actinomycetota bacterium]
MTDLGARLDLPAPTVGALRRDGHVIVRDVLDETSAAALRDALAGLVSEHALDRRPLEQRSTYGKAFLQAMNLWRLDETVARVVLAPRLAALAADLLGVDAVRLYHDQALWKEPGGGPTPWHQDQLYWPLDTDRTITMWLALDDVGVDVGGLRFVSGSHTRGPLASTIISDESEETFAELIDRTAGEVSDNPPLRPGDASFHLGWTVHGAGPNLGTGVRAAMTVIWFADGARLVEPDSPERRHDAEQWLPGVGVGGLAASDLNPVLWPIR